MAKLYFLLFITLFGGLVNCGVPGAPRPITDKAELATLASNLTTHLVNVGTNGNKLQFFKLHSASSKVVAGVKYDMIVEIVENDNNVNCTVGMWEKSWEDFVQLDMECGEEKRKYEYTGNIAKPEIIAFGGFQTLTDDDIKRVHPKLSHSFNEMCKKDNTFKYSLHRIKDGKKQTVAGFRSEMNIEAKNVDGKTVDCVANMIETLDRKLMVDITCEANKFNIVTPDPQ